MPGVFWMSFQEFLRHFNRLHFTETVQSLKGTGTVSAFVSGVWQGASAGGHDGNPGWRHNPSFSVSAPRGAVVTMLLTQPDRRQQAREAGESTAPQLFLSFPFLFPFFFFFLPLPPLFFPLIYTVLMHILAS